MRGGFAHTEKGGAADRAGATRGGCTVFGEDWSGSSYLTLGATFNTISFQSKPPDFLTLVNIDTIKKYLLYS
jgi:hypothetical protein